MIGIGLLTQLKQNVVEAIVHPHDSRLSSRSGSMRSFTNEPMTNTNEGNTYLRIDESGFFSNASPDLNSQI